MSGIIVALVTLATMLFLAPLLGRMPHATLAADPGLAALLYSAERTEQFTSCDPAMVEFRGANPLVLQPVAALLVAQQAGYPAAWR